MDRAREMMLFAKVVEEGSFSAASRALDLTPSAVSKQISRLESRLGARLIGLARAHDPPPAPDRGRPALL